MRPNINIPSEKPPAKKVPKNPQVALVLGSGGARGYAHLGVIKVLADAGIPISMIVSSSAGSIVGALYADSLNPNKVIYSMFKANFWTFADISNLPSIKGVVQGYHTEKFLLKNMHARWFDQLKIPLIVLTTDLKTGEEYPINSGPIAPATLASAAIPGVVKPIHLYGHALIDGGMADPIPVDVAKKYHPKLIIAVDISQELLKSMPYTAWGIYDRGMTISWVKFAKLDEKNANIVIRPHVGNVGDFDFSARYKLFLAGEKAAKKALPQIKKLLKEKHISLVKKT